MPVGETKNSGMSAKVKTPRVAAFGVLFWLVVFVVTV